MGSVGKTITGLSGVVSAVILRLLGFIADRPARVDRRENIIVLGPSGVGKPHVAIGIGLAACQHGTKTHFATAAAIVHELIEAQNDKRLLRLQTQLASHELLIIDELGFVPLSKTSAEQLFELIS